MARRFKHRPFWHQNPIYVDLSKVKFIDTSIRHCGEYDTKKIKNAVFKFPDDTHNKDCYVRFRNGDIWLEERKRDARHIG